LAPCASPSTVSSPSSRTSPRRIGFLSSADRTETAAEQDPGWDGHGGVLEIDLDAIIANWRLLSARAAPAACAAVVKADAYGLGAAAVVRALARAGCSSFFVALPAEGAVVREAAGPEARVAVLGGFLPEAAALYRRHALIPVLSAPEQIDAWRPTGGSAPAFIHVDTGMSRLGLTHAEWSALDVSGGGLERLGVIGVISHLACAEEADNPANAAQLAAFRAALAALPRPLPASLANSSGIFLGADYHFDLVRPGAALYGVNPAPGSPNPMRPVVRLRGRILQVRQIDRGVPVGYGASFIAPAPRKLATVAVGYADGLHRAASSRGRVLCHSHPAPIVGRVSMDMITVDVTDVPQDAARPGESVDIIGPGRDIDAVAADAGTIGYEILTSLGSRFRRRYLAQGGS
jgi:alanine racemase